MLALYYAPGACSLAPHIALEEAGIAFEPRRVDMAAGGTRTPEYLAINPHGRVPVLMVDDIVLTEGPAILGYIGRLAPEARLLPSDPLAAARVAALLAWFSGTVHVAFARMFRPERIVPDAAMHDAVKASARESVVGYLGEIEALLGDRPWLVGDGLTIADLYPFVFQRWAGRNGFDLTAHPALARLAWRLLDRPAVQRALATEGLASSDWVAVAD